MFLLKKLIRLLQVQTMIKEQNQLIQQKHAYGTSKDPITEKEEIKYKNT